MTPRDGASEPDDGPDKRAERERARRRARVFGEVLPESTRDDRDPDAGAAGERDDEWFRRNVPPHHG